jgi:hypothetical protein
MNHVCCILVFPCTGDDKAFVQNLFTMHPKHARLTQITRIKKEGAKGIIPVNAFSIVHYAGTVIYNAKVPDIPSHCLLVYPCITLSVCMYVSMGGIIR